MPLPARSSAEAHAYIELHPCDACGTGFQPPNKLVMVDGDLASRYHGLCPTCGAPREFFFGVPDESRLQLPPGDRVRYGGDEPSQIIDASEWVRLAERIAARVPVDPALVPPERHDEYRYALTGAVAAMDEALKFVPPGADQVPLDALWTDQGRALHEARPSRLLRGVLLAVRDAYQEIVDRYPPPGR